MRRLRRPSGLSSGSTPGLSASPEMPGSLAESFWGLGAKSRSLCLLPGLLPSWPLHQVLTSEPRKDRKGIREFEGLVSENRGCGSLGLGSLAQP